MKKEIDIVSLKSYNSQTILNIFTKSYDDAIDNLNKKFEKGTFFKNMKINSINAPELDIVEVQRIKDFLKEKFNIDYQEKKPKKITNSRKKSVNSTKKSEGFQQITQFTSNILKDESKVMNMDMIKDTEYKTKIVKANLRSGASINYDGNILVIGDVNAGAELIASGNVIVFGIIRGFVSAGAKGDKNAMVVANNISATQLRIAEFIAIPPKNDVKDISGLQMAIINEDKVEIQKIK